MLILFVLVTSLTARLLLERSRRKLGLQRVTTSSPRCHTASAHARGPHAGMGASTLDRQDKEKNA